MTPTSPKYCPFQDAGCWLGSRWNVGFAVAGGPMVTGYLWWVNAMERLPSSVELGFRWFLAKLSEVVMLLLPNGQSSQFTFQSLLWETVVHLPVTSLLVGLLFTFRLVQSVRSRLYVRHEKQLAETLAAQIDKKCWQVPCCQKWVCRDGDIFRECQAREWINKWKLRKVNLILRQELNCLVQELIKERFMQSKQEEEMEEMLKVSSPWKRWWEPPDPKAFSKPARRPSTEPWWSLP